MNDNTHFMFEFLDKQQNWTVYYPYNNIENILLSLDIWL